MAGEPLALSTVPPPSTADADYEAICAAVTATARGRWFLDEFGKRNRNSDTTQVLAAIARMEAAVVGERVQQASREAHQEVRIELLEMARTIAQARAEVAESRPASPQQPSAVGPASAATPELAAAAERLRQIAWTLRACGVDLPASEQIAEIAGAILSADALRDLGEQRAQTLTEALHYLEHRIERMLDGHRATTNETAGAEPTADAPPAELQGAARDTALATMAVAMIAAAMKPDVSEAAAAPATPAAAPMDDDVVLTVADSTVEPAPETAATVSAEPEFVPAEPEPIAEPIEPEPPTEVVAALPEAERVVLEIEPLLPAPPPTPENDAGQFTGLELEPLAVIPAAAAEAEAESQASEVDEPDSGANDNRPLMLVTAVTAPAAAQTDTIAMQVDQDLDGLTDDLPFAGPAPGDPPQQEQPVVAHASADDDAAAPPVKVPPRGAPVSALVASAQASRAQLSDTLAAIESELFGSTRPDAHGNPPESIPAPAPKPAAAPAPDSPLATLMAMSDEERIAMFS